LITSHDIYEDVKVGLNAWTLGGWHLHLPGGVDGLLHAAATLGYDGVEIVYDDAAFSPSKIDRAARAHLRDLASSYGLSLPSVATAVFWRYSLSSPDNSEREKALTLLRQGLELAADLGAQVLLVIPAVARPTTPYRDTYRLALSSIRSSARWAEDLGVKIGIENVWNRFLYDPLIFRMFIEEVGSESVGLYFDVGNVIEISPFEHWLEILGDMILMVHAKDYDFRERGPSGFRPVGRGSVDWPRFIRGLRDVGYKGFINVETPPELEKEGPSLRYPRDGLAAARLSLQNLRIYLAEADKSPDQN